MCKPLSAILVCMALLYQTTSLAQNKFYRINQLEVDRAKAILGKQCRAYASSASTPGGKNKADKKLIGFLNEFYNNYLTVNDLTKKLDQFNKKWSYTSTDLGGTVKYETPVRSEGNIQATISFAVFQNEIVFKRIYFKTVTNTTCTGSASAYIEPVDINYLDLYCLQTIEFPLSFPAQTGIVESETTSYEKLASLSTGVYKLPSADSLYINKMVWNEDDTYNPEKVDPRFLLVTGNHNTYILYQLLYSPNHIVALYSLEALVFLKEAHIANHPDYILQKMEEVKNAPIKIAWQDSGVVKNGITYLELQISTEKIVDKYRKGLIAAK